MNRLIAIAALALAACSSPAERLERQYEMVSGKSEKCRLAAQVRDAWLAEEDERNYHKWRTTATFDCYRAQFP